MLAGILITVLVLAGLGFGLPWLAANRETPDKVDGDPEERFSDSMRILRRDVIDYQEPSDTAQVSTPLTRRAELKELRLHSRAAAARRARTAGLLTFALLGVGIAAGIGALQWWSVSIPVTVLLAFFGFSRLSVRAMRRRFDARADAVVEGYGDEEATQVIAVPVEEESAEISVDLAAPIQTGALWDPIPVTAPTYVSKPLVPRTVRTIDLSAPAATPAVVPTADRPDRDVEDLELEETERNVLDFPRAVGE